MTKEDIRQAYRLMLGRDPGDSEVSEKYNNRIASLAELRDLFLTSDEFLRGNPGWAAPYATRDYLAGKPNVEVMIEDPGKFQRLIDRVMRQWRSLGETQPYWSVITGDDFLLENINDEGLVKFYESGFHTAQLIDVFADRAAVAVPRKTCFELGCGVGRITAVLATQFDHVIAADISPGNLKLCEIYLKNQGIKNVETILIKHPDDIKEIALFDFFLSMIVLQHNPPPVQHLLLSHCLQGLKPSGLALFQTPDNLKLPNGESYTFSVDEFLEEKDEIMDMHCLPKSVVLNLAASKRLQVLDIAPDFWIGQVGSFTYFLQKQNDQAQAGTVPSIPV